MCHQLRRAVRIIEGDIRTCVGVTGLVKNLSVFTDAETCAGVAGAIPENLCILADTEHASLVQACSCCVTQHICVLSDAEGAGMEGGVGPQDLCVFTNLQQVPPMATKTQTRHRGGLGQCGTMQMLYKASARRPQW